MVQHTQFQIANLYSPAVGVFTMMQTQYLPILVTPLNPVILVRLVLISLHRGFK